jgi:hypothetical protein
VAAQEEVAEAAEEEAIRRRNVITLGRGSPRILRSH